MSSSNFTPALAFAAAAAIATTICVKADVLVDELNDFSKMSSHSSTLQFDISSPGNWFGDPSRLCRTSTTSSPSEYIVYNVPGATQISLVGFFNSQQEPIVDFKFYTSGDGTSWTNVTASYVDSLFNNNYWTQRVYTSATFQSGVKYVKVEFRPGGLYVWDPLISQLTITYTPPAPAGNPPGSAFSTLQVGGSQPGTWTSNGSDIFLNTGVANSSIFLRPGGDGSGAGQIAFFGSGYQAFFDGNGIPQVVFAQGNVGIGTTAPANSLSIVGPFTPGYMQLAIRGTTADDRSGISLWSATGPRLGEFYIGNEKDFIFGIDQPGRYRLFSGNVERFTIDALGNVGIGVGVPSGKLDVNQGATAVGARVISNSDANIRLNDGLIDSAEFRNLDTRGTRLVTLGDRYLAVGTLTAQPLVLVTSNTERLVIGSNGNIGIGTSNPTQKLSVNGTIRAKEIVVETAGWSDYVFDPGYKLAPLSEVERCIQQSRHLPGIPSAATVEREGVTVGEMQAKLLAKIEELTLHAIAQEKRLTEVEAENMRLRELLQK